MSRITLKLVAALAAVAAIAVPTLQAGRSEASNAAPGNIGAILIINGLVFFSQ